MNIYKKIPAIMAEVGAIEKSRQGQGIQYKFRGIDDIYMALQPLLSKHGVFFAPTVIAQSREERKTNSGGTLTFSILTVKFTFYADDGSHVECVTVGEAMDTSDKSSNKAMSAALKYATLQVFCIPTEEEKDTEYQNHAPAPRMPQEQTSTTSPAGEQLITESQLKRLYALQKKSGIPDEAMKAIGSAMGITTRSAIPRAKYDQLCHLVENWKP